MRKSKKIFIIFVAVLGVAVYLAYFNSQTSDLLINGGHEEKVFGFKEIMTSNILWILMISVAAGIICGMYFTSIPLSLIYKKEFEEGSKGKDKIYRQAIKINREAAFSTMEKYLSKEDFIKAKKDFEEAVNKAKDKL